MDNSSRTAKSLKNSAVAMTFYVINLALQFFSRKIFLEYLGSEILGLNTTAMNLLQFLNLAELGISAAVGFTLYKPIHDDDRQTINEIVTLQGHLYRRIAWMIIAGAAVLMCFFPWIFAKMELPLWYAYASFGVLLFSALLGYFVNFRQVLLSASQQEYKIVYSFKATVLLKVLLQMLAVWKLENGYVWWAILETLFAIIGAITLHIVTMKNFPYLQNVSLTFRELRQKHKIIETKIKQLFFHKFGGFVLNQTSPIIIYAYTNLTLVALYGNYMIITLGILSLVTSIFNGQSASIGDLVVEGNKDNILRVFQDLFCIRFIIVSTICYCAYFLIPPFIILWIGSDYLLPDEILVLLLVILFIQIFRPSIETFSNAYGLYNDIWAPVIEAFINISLSILFGYYWGLSGILIGVLISLIAIVVVWKPYYLFSRCMYDKIDWYVRLYVKQLLFVIPGALFVYWVKEYTKLIKINGWLEFVSSSALIIILFSTPLIILTIATTRSLRQRIAHWLKCMHI